MKPAYARISWGLALEMIDFRIQGIDGLPDVLGYLLVLAGLAGIRPGSKPLALGRAAAGTQLVLSLPWIVGQPIAFNLMNMQPPGMSALLLSAAGTVVEMAMLFGICSVIRDRARSAGQTELADAARSTWHGIFGLGAGWLFVFPFSLNMTPADLVIVLTVVSLAFFVACLRAIFLVRKAGKASEGTGGNPVRPG